MAIRSRNIYNPEGEKPFKLSRTKVDNYINCKRCFYIDRRLGVGQPPGFPFNINSAVDELLKKEFDQYRGKKEPHPYIETLGINAIPYHHEDLDKWRHNFTGVQYLHESTNLILHGAIDDVWIDQDSEELIVVDYKATSKDGEVTIDADWQAGYRRQIDFYQYLLRMNGFKVSNDGYFVYCNGDRKKESFGEKMEFKVSLLKYTGSTDWIEPVIQEIKDLLDGDKIPKENGDCDYCTYLGDISSVTK